MSNAVFRSTAINSLHAWALLLQCRMLRHLAVRFARASTLRPSTLTTLRHAVSSSAQRRCSLLTSDLQFIENM